MAAWIHTAPRSAAAGLLAVLVIAAGPGLAASIQLDLGEVPDPVDPTGPAASTTARLEVSCPSSDEGGEPRNVNLSASAGEPWASPTLEPDRFEVPVDQCREAPWEAEPDLTVAVSRDAPAFASTEVQVSAELTTSEANGTASDRVTVTPGYHQNVTAAFEMANVTVDPEDGGTALLRVDNHSNGDTRFEFALANPETVRQVDLKPVVPEPTVLGSTATGAETTGETIPVRVIEPGGNVTEAFATPMEIRVRAFYAGHPSIGSTNRTAAVDLWVPASKNTTQASTEPGDDQLAEDGPGRSVPGLGAAGTAALSGLLALRRGEGKRRP